jgi:hypothetical protein
LCVPRARLACPSLCARSPSTRTSRQCVALWIVSPTARQCSSECPFAAFAGVRRGWAQSRGSDASPRCSEAHTFADANEAAHARWIALLSWTVVCS